MSISDFPTPTGTDNNADSTKGLKAWEARRKAWLTPNETYLQATNNSSEGSVSMQRFDEILQSGAQRLHVYKQLVNQRYALRGTIPLKYIIPCLVTGWQEDGVWPKGMVVQQTNSD